MDRTGTSMCVCTVARKGQWSAELEKGGVLLSSQPLVGTSTGVKQMLVKGKRAERGRGGERRVGTAWLGLGLTARIQFFG